jgi:hypothetical protein
MWVALLAFFVFDARITTPDRHVQKTTIVKSPIVVVCEEVVTTGTGDRVRLRRDTDLRLLSLVVENFGKRSSRQRQTHCPTYYALLEHHYSCPNICPYPWCACSYLAGPGGGTAETDTEACAIAHAEECSQIEYGCNYNYCEHLTNWVGLLAGESGGNCTYYYYGNCPAVGCP